MSGAPPQTPHRSIHPGAGRRRGRNLPRGRQVEPDALAEVQALLGPLPRQRDLLIEYLHLLQDHYGCLHARHLAALAQDMKLALVEVYEVASFYAHFDIVMDGEPAPPALTVRVCDSLTCALMGAEELLAELETREAFGRAAEPWEVANVIIFLASDLASYMTGEIVSVSSQHP